MTMDRFTQDMADMAGDSDASQRSRSRDSLFLMAQLRLGESATVHEVRVRNLSEGGLMVELDRVVEVGTPVELEVRGIGDITGKIAWCTQGRIGIALDAPIDPKKARKPVGVGKSSPEYLKPVLAPKTPRR
jgi:hypothetical protein